MKILHLHNAEQIISMINILVTHVIHTLDNVIENEMTGYMSFPLSCMGLGTRLIISLPSSS